MNIQRRMSILENAHIISTFAATATPDERKLALEVDGDTIQYLLTDATPEELELAMWGSSQKTEKIVR